MTKKNPCFSINFIKNFVIYFGPGTSLFDKNKDAVSGKILFFGNILGFLGINWSQKWTKIVNFRCVLFPLKHLISKDCSDLSLSYKRSSSGQNFSKRESNLGEKGTETSQKRSYNGRCIATKTFGNLYLDNHKCYTNETYQDYVPP